METFFWILLFFIVLINKHLVDPSRNGTIENTIIIPPRNIPPEEKDEKEILKGIEYDKIYDLMDEIINHPELCVNKLNNIGDKIEIFLPFEDIDIKKKENVREYAKKANRGIKEADLSKFTKMVGLGYHFLKAKQTKDPKTDLSVHMESLGFGKISKSTIDSYCKLYKIYSKCNILPIYGIITGKLNCTNLLQTMGTKMLQILDLCGKRWSGCDKINVPVTIVDAMPPYDPILIASSNKRKKIN
eukprot:TRINITY_DN1808_c0_g2_i1.p1 TRINITY_DN1808_c0_g2~~TRINITY_DN1808_c0_g2_i1.p1  ORF type:complete len:244 (-),score=23.39 TRINITY_DN1808_c0_g2_i1:10-741(-)